MKIEPRATNHLNRSIAIYGIEPTIKGLTPKQIQDLMDALLNSTSITKKI
jgi:hypothetical protein